MLEATENYDHELYRGLRGFTFLSKCSGKLKTVGTTPSRSRTVCPVRSRDSGVKWLPHRAVTIRLPVCLMHIAYPDCHNLQFAVWNYEPHNVFGSRLITYTVVCLLHVLRLYNNLTQDRITEWADGPVAQGPGDSRALQGPKFCFYFLRKVQFGWIGWALLYGPPFERACNRPEIFCRNVIFCKKFLFWRAHRSCLGDSKVLPGPLWDL